MEVIIKWSADHRLLKTFWISEKC